MRIANEHIDDFTKIAQDVIAQNGYNYSVDVSSGIVPDESKEILHDTMSDEEYDLVTSSDSDSELTFKFKLVEFFENFRLKLASN